MTFQDVSERSEGSALQRKMGIIGSPPVLAGLSSLVPYSLILRGSVPTTATQIYFAIFSIGTDFSLPSLKLAKIC